MDYFNSLMAILKKWDHLGSRVTQRGVRLIGETPSLIQKNKLITLHIVYEALDEADTLCLEKLLGHPLPEALRAFYSMANGLSIFGGILSIKGLRHDYSRALNDEGMYQPVSLEYGNATERPRGCEPEMTFFGWYNYDASKVYARSDNKKIFMCPRYTVEPTICEWPDFQTFLLNEASRLGELFDERGYIIDEDITGLPPEALQRAGQVH